MIDPIRPISLDDIEQAHTRIAGTVLRSPLVKLDLGTGGPEIYLKLENLQPTNAYKIRGAVNAVARLSNEQRARGVWTISAGNAGQAVAFAAITPMRSKRRPSRVSTCAGATPNQRSSTVA